MRHQLEKAPQWRRTLPVYSLVYLLKGDGRFYDEGDPAGRAVTAGDLLCLFPNSGHAYAPSPGTRWDEINVEFSGFVFDAWIGQGLLDPDQPIRHLEPITHWHHRFREAVLPLARPPRESTLVDTGRLLGLIAEMCATWHRPAQEADIAWSEKARHDLLTLPPRQRLDYHRAARAFGLGEQAYRKKFRRLCGVTPTEFRARHLIEQACHLLHTSDLPIKEIAYTLGFASEFYFMRRFKQITGFPPGEYRRHR